MARVLIGVGSNLGNRVENFRRGEKLLRAADAIRFLRSSPVYETDPVGGNGQGKYLNAVWEIETSLAPQDLLICLLRAEEAMGRRRSFRNAPRTLDLDILFYDEALLETQDLVIPHPRLHERFFVLKPLNDLVPEWVHPKFGVTVREMLEKCREGNPKS